MAKFQKGKPRPKGAGRKPGSKNKVTRAVKEVFAATFNELQSDPRRNLLAWAQRNRSNLAEFYKIAARFIPLEATVAPAAPVSADGMGALARARRVAFVLNAGKAALDAQDRIDRGALLPAPREIVINPK